MIKGRPIYLEKTGGKMSKKDNMILILISFVEYMSQIDSTFKYKAIKSFSL